jgi:hypothetical protein
MEATTRARNWARAVIVLGYGIAALGALISFIQFAADGGLRYSSNADVEAIGSLFAYLATVAAWWFLSQIVASTVVRRSLVRRALMGLMLEAIFAAIATLAFVVNARALAWPVVGDGLTGLGALVSAVGFYSLFVTYRKGFGAQRPIDVPSTA